jgi:hypothetical protein
VRRHTGPSGWYLTGREDGQASTKEFVVERTSDVSLDDPGTASPTTDTARPSLDPLSWLELFTIVGVDGDLGAQPL